MSPPEPRHNYNDSAPAIYTLQTVQSCTHTNKSALSNKDAAHAETALSHEYRYYINQLLVAKLLLLSLPIPIGSTYVYIYIPHSRAMASACVNRLTSYLLIERDQSYDPYVLWKATVNIIHVHLGIDCYTVLMVLVVLLITMSNVYISTIHKLQ